VAFLWELRFGAKEAVLLKDRLLSLRGDPRLTRWEEQFVVSIQRSIEEHGPQARLSDKQIAVLLEVKAKTDASEPEEQGFEEAGPDGSAL
jgi:hypothetical protein